MRRKRIGNLLYMIGVARFQHKPQIAAVDIGRFAGTLMMHADDVSAAAGDNFGHLLLLSRLIE